MTRTFVLPAGTMLPVSSSATLDTAPLDERTAANVPSAPALVVIDWDADAPEPAGRSTSVWPPDVGAAVPIEPAARSEIATLPSIRTSTGPVKAFTTRNDG